MNNTFSYHRFLSLLQKDAADLQPKFIRRMLISFGIGLAIFLFASFVIKLSGTQGGREYDAMRLAFGSAVLLFNMIFAPFQLYKRFNHRNMGVNHFMLPASQLEKWLSMFFYCVIVTPVLIIASLTLADLCLLPFYPWEGVTLWFSGAAFSFVTSLSMLDSLFLKLLSIQSVFFLCNIWFQEAKVRNTFIIIIVIIVFNIILSSLMTAFAFNPASADLVVKMSGNNDSAYKMVATIRDAYGASDFTLILRRTLSILTTLGLWYASFLKWKEQEL